MDEDKRKKGIHQKTPTLFSSDTYKTEECENKYCKSDDCLKYHDLLEKRRNPILFSYSSIPCNFVYYNSAFASPEDCPNKDLCDLAHSKAEVYYHPSMYKTKPCKCSPCYTKFCAFRHPGEFPEIEELKEPASEVSIPREESNQDELKDEKIEKVEINLNEKEKTSETPEKPKPFNKLACKLCKDRDIKWVFECGSLSCSKCIGKVCPKCNKKHINRLDI